MTEGIALPVISYTVHSSCPLCHSSCIVKIGKLGYSGLTRYSSFVVNIQESPQLWMCKDCGSGFVQNSVDRHTSERLYALGSSSKRWTARTFAETKTNAAFQVLKSLLKPGISVLDIGANTGELLDFAKQSGCNTAGLEYSNESRVVLASKGHKTYGSFDEITASYDVVTAFDLLEHLYDVPGFFERVHQISSSNAKLLILTGDIECFSSKFTGASWWYAQFPEHIVFPSRNYLNSNPFFAIKSITKTWAGKDYCNYTIFPIARLLVKLVLGFLRLRVYEGAPSLGPDHMLIVSQKKEALPWNSCSDSKGL